MIRVDEKEQIRHLGISVVLLIETKPLGVSP